MEEELKDDFLELCKIILNEKFVSISLYHDNYYIGLFSIVKDEKDKYNIKITYNGEEKEFRFEIIYGDILYQTVYFNKYRVDYKAGENA
jgi:hypothetical protein